MEKVVEIDGKEVGFKASAATPYMYRSIFGRDLIKDMVALYNSYRVAEASTEYSPEEEKNAARLTAVDLQIFLNASWVMAREYDRSIPGVEEWLEGFEMFSIYKVFPVIIDLWGLNNKTLATPKKK